MFLTDDELKDLTGYQRHADQRQWLLRHAWTFVVAATGRPIVSRAYAENQMGAAQPKQATWTPNVAAIQKRA